MHESWNLRYQERLGQEFTAYLLAKYQLMFSSEQYNTAIAHLTRHAPSTPQVPILLTSCILFMKLELFDHNKAAVSQYLGQGLNILKRWRISKASSAKAARRRCLTSCSNSLEEDTVYLLGALRFPADPGCELLNQIHTLAIQRGGSRLEI